MATLCVISLEENEWRITGFKAVRAPLNQITFDLSSNCLTTSLNSISLVTSKFIDYQSILTCFTCLLVTFKSTCTVHLIVLLLLSRISRLRFLFICYSRKYPHSSKQWVFTIYIKYPLTLQTLLNKKKKQYIHGNCIGFIFQELVGTHCLTLSPTKQVTL